MAHLNASDAEYLCQHAIPNLVEGLIQKLLVTKPERPVEFLTDLLSHQTTGAHPSVSHASGGLQELQAIATSEIPLKPATLAIVKQTAPVLEQHGVAITSCFYGNLFRKHPALKGVFNMTHQVKDAAGSGAQPRALAGAVLAYAQNVDNLGALAEPVMRIAHKHVSVGVVPEQYPIVGENLLGAIKEVLGSAATPEIINAWGEAYGVLAKVFIDVEEGIYKDLEKRPGGWRGWRSFTVVQRVAESTEATSFYLEPSDKKGVCPYAAGQYTCLRLRIPGQEWPVLRNYTVSSAQGGKQLRITVKKQEATHAGGPPGIASHYLHNVVDVGTQLDLAPPTGDFVLKADERPLVLISAGVGVTPMLSMLQEAVDIVGGKQPIYFIHGTRDLSTHVLKQEVEAIAQRRHNVKAHYFYSRVEVPAAHHGRVTPAEVLKIAGGTRASFYLCGPLSFLKDLRQGLTQGGVAAADIHYENFGPRA